MPYLTYEDYQFWGTASVDEQNFPKLLQKASDVVDSVTRSFYQFNDIEQDAPFRREQFKKAVAAQVDYFADSGATNAHGLNSPLSVSIGRTQISNGATNQNKLNTIVSDDVYMYLKDTGLLYRGIGVM